MEHLYHVLAGLVLASVVVESQGTVPYLSLGTTNYTNHSYLQFDNIGLQDSFTDLECHTDLVTCCNNADGEDRGNWYYPNGTRVPFNGNEVNFLRRSQRVDLARNGGAVSSVANGIYRCTIETNAVRSDNSNDTTTGEVVYVGIYTSGGGDARIQGEIGFQEFAGSDGETSHFVLTCISAGGPATTVIWRRDNVQLNGDDRTSVLDDPVTAHYTHTLTVMGGTEGEYACIVANDKPFTNIRYLTVAAPDPPSNLQVIQNGMTSVLASWTPSSGGDPSLTTGYTIRLAPLQESGATVTATAAATETSTTIFGLTLGATYSVTIVANSNTLSSNVTGPENVTIETVEVMVSVAPSSLVMIGDTVTLSCSAVLPNGVVGPPSFQWDGPDDTAAGSTLVISAIELGQAGRYTCTVVISFFNISESTNITVQVEAPQPMIEGSHGGPLYEGTAYNLTCAHQLDNRAINSSTVEWTVNGGMVDTTQTRIATSDDRLTFNPLATSDSGSYACLLTLTTQEYVVILNPQQQPNPVEVMVEGLPSPQVTTTSDSQLRIGDQLVLECTVSVVVPHLVTRPSLRWERAPGDSLTTGIGDNLSHNLTVEKTSTAGVYTCVLTIDVPAISLLVTGESRTTLTVQMPQPSIVINPNRPGTLYAGSNLTLSCVVTLDPAVVDTPTDVVIMWSGPRTIPGEWYTVSDTATDNLQFSSHLSITPLAKDRDNGEYVCSATVSTASDYILGTGGSNSTTLEITSPPPLTVNIETSGLLLTGQSYMFECTANVVEDLISSLDLELLAPNGMPLASVTSPDSNTLLYSLSSLDTSDGGEYKCRAVLVIPGSGVDSSTTATKFITVVDAYPVEDVAVAFSSSSALELTWGPPHLGANLTIAFVLTCTPLLEGIPVPESVMTSSGDELTLSLTELYPGVSYNCSVVTVTTEGQSQPVSKVQATEEIAPMGPPLSLEVIVGATDVTFTWSLPQVTLRNGEITGFTLSCFSGGALMLRRSFSAPGTYKVSGFSSATAYNCSVVAVNSKGDGPPATLALRTQTAPTGDSGLDVIPVVAGIVAVVFIVSVMVILVVLTVVIVRRRRRKYSLNRAARPNSYITKTADSCSATVTANPNTNEGDYSVIKTGGEGGATAPPEYEMIQTYSQLPPGKRPAPQYLHGTIDLTVNQHAESDIDGQRPIIKGGIVPNPQYEMLPAEMNGNGAAAMTDLSMQSPQYEMIDNYSRVGKSENMYEVPKSVAEVAPKLGPVQQYSVPQSRHNTISQPISQPSSTRTREDVLSSYSVPRSRNYTVTQGVGPQNLYNVPRSQQNTGTIQQLPLPTAPAAPTNPYDRLDAATNTRHEQNGDSDNSNK